MPSPPHPFTICMVHSFFHNRGGDTTYAHQLSKDLRQRGHVVHPFSMQHPLNNASPNQRYFAPWTTLSQGKKQRLWDIVSLIWSRSAASSFADMLDHIKPDIIHIQHLHRHLTPSILAEARQRNIPIVWTLHDYEILCPSGKMVRNASLCTKCVRGSVLNAARHRCKWNATAPSLLSALEHGIHRLIGIENWVDAFICPSDFLASQLAQRIPPHRIHHIPNPIHFPVLREPSKKQWIVAGRLSSEKGFDVAIQAALELPQYPLLICGDGPERQALERLAKGAAHIQFLGMLPHAEVQRHIQESTLVAVPSKWPENFPYAVIEAQALGRPVIGSQMGGIVEQITHEQSGLLIPPNDPEMLRSAVARLFDAPEWAQQIGQRARAQVEESCQIAPHLRQIEEIYTHQIMKRVS